MSTIADKISYLNTTKELIKAAIESKGVSVPAGTPFRGYAGLVESISSDGGDDGSNEEVTVTGYVVGTPMEFTIPASDWDGSNYLLKITGYKIGDNGVQIGLPANATTTNTQEVITAALTIPHTYFSAATDTAAAYTDLTISAVNVPSRDIVIAVFGLEVV